MASNKRNSAILSGTSLLTVALVAIQPAIAQDTTIATSISTGTTWSGASSPGTNFTITSTGTINVASGSAITITGGPGAALGTLENSGLVNDTSGGNMAIFIGATSSDTISLAALNNLAGGTISGVATGIVLNTLGTIGVLTNAGRISGFSGVGNYGSIGSISNTGVIAGTRRGISNNFGGAIGTINNSGTISVGAGASQAAGGVANNGGSILTLINTGTIISSSSSGVGNNQTSASIGQITNSGLISGATGGLWNSGTMSQVTNTGRIIGAQAGVFHTSGTIGTINNSGTISGGSYGISIGTGSFNSLINSGTVRGAIALDLGSGVSSLNVTNSGVIAGSIVNRSTNVLTINGGTGATFGTLTGSTLTNKGSIISTLANLEFASGNLVLNSNINATGRTVVNDGATLLLNSGINLAGAFNQITGTLIVDPLGGLIATGVATVSGGTIQSNFASTGNYLAGTYTLLGGSSLNLFGATVDIGTLANLDRSINATGTALQLLINNSYVGGTLATVSNAAALTSSDTGLFVATTGSIGTFSNTGTLGGNQFGVNNRGTIGLLSNSGRITNNNFTALWNQGSIGQLVNTGTITNSSWAILNSGTISTLTNSGVIAGAGNAVQNNAVMTLIDNSGTMSGGSGGNAIAGVFGTVRNSGLFLGNVNGNGGTIGTIIGGSGGTVGTFTGFNGVAQGTIGVDANLTFASGALLLNDTITVKNVAASGVTVSNSGADITLATIVNVNANFSQSAGSLNLGNAGKLAVTQAATFSGGTITTGANGFSSTSTYLKGAAGGTLVSGGVGSNYTGVSIVASGGFTGLAFGSATSGTDLLLSANNIYVGDTQASINNSDSISGTTWALYVANTGAIGTLINSGTLTGLNDGLSSNGSIGNLSNSGLISGGQKGLGNQSTITNLTNTSTGSIIGGTAAGLQNDTSMGTLTNAGLISSGSAGFANYGTLGLLSNSGSINGGPQGIYLDGNSNTGAINNSGTITSGQSAVQVSGTLGSLVNSGYIGNATNAVNVAGTLATLVNADGGTISGNNVIYISGSLGGLSNSGVIRGRIDNQTANNLTITGGAAGTIGTLTGTSGIGTINNTLSNVVFASGNLLLNDRIIATGRTVSNTGASLSLTSNISITGNYSQSAGTLSLTPGTSSLIVSGAANLSGGTVLANLSSTANYLAGNHTLVSGGASSSFAGATVSTGTITGLSSASSISGNSLLLAIANDYVGGSLTTLANAASLTSAATGLYVATTGIIGAVSNTGTLGGAQFGVNNRGTIGTLGNSGLITNANFTALWNQGSIGQLVNSGTITNSSWAILNSGTIGTVTNSGVITGAGVALQNNAVIAVVNNSGTLSGQNALAGTFGTVINSGLIRGNINPSGGVIGTIIGGSGGAIGTFTGSTGTTQGTIGASANLTFAAGALLLNDAINAVGIAASALTVSNTGADITLATIVNIDGNFSQSAGMLNLGTTGKLVVSQAANFTGGTIAAGGFSATANYLAGTNAGTLVSGGAGSNYGGVAIDVAGVSGLEAGAVTSGNDLVMAVSNNYVGGSLGTLNNATSLNATNAIYVAATGSLGSLINSDTITANAGVVNQGSIGGIANSGLFNVTGTAIFNNGSIGQVSNTGSIAAAGSAGIYNGGTIAAITNSGALINSQASAGSGQIGAIVNAGSLGALTNSGTIAGPVALSNSGSLGTIANSGTIAGNIENVAAQDLVFTGGTGGTFGTLTGYGAGSQGTITNLAGNVVMASGGIVLNDAVNVGTGTLINSGATIQLASIVAVTGNYSQASGTLALGQSALQVSGIADINGGLITTTQFDAAGNYIVGVAAGTLVQGGMGSSYVGVDVASGINGLSIATSIGTIGTNVNLLLTLQNDYVGGTIANLNNTGTITGVSTAAFVAATGSIGTLTNSGVLDGTVFGLNNNGVIDLIANSGTISGTVGVFNGGTIGTILNTGSMIDSPAILAAGLNSAGVIGAVINQGTISGEARGLYNDGQIGNVTNSGTIAGELALYNGGSIGTLNNSGVLLDSAAPTSAALNNAGTLNVAINSGTITGVTYGILNSGTLGELGNSGTIQAVTAIYNSGTLGSIANTGVIAGNIENVSARDLTFTGASGSDMGTLTGQGGGRGTITNLVGNVVFASGNLLLNDDVVATGHAVTNTGAVLTLQNSAAVTGDFSQTAGSLVLATGQQLNVSGAASLTGGGVATTLPAAANYLAGTTAATLVTGGAGSTYAGVSVTTGPVTGLALTSGSSGNNLVVTANNNYIGADLASLTNSGSLTADYPVYVAEGGSLGALANSGTLSGSIAAIYNAGTLGPIANTGVIAGNIQNVSEQALTFTGASGTMMGTLTGQGSGRGTITNTGGNVVFASGNLLLNDDVAAAGHAVTNTGAALTLQNSAAITGDYSQTAGSLVLATAKQLNVSGAASLTGGSVTTTLPTAANYLAGSTAATLVTGGAGSTYTGVSVSTNPITGLALTSGASGNNFVLTANNHYVGATLASLTNSGTVRSDYGAYIAAGGSLAALTNTGTLSGSVAAIRNAGTLGLITNTGVIAGDIENLSSADLRIAGGAGTSFGTLTGFGAGSMGTIRNLASNIVVSGNLLLNDAVNVGTRSLINSGGTLQLNNVVPVTGNYSQTGGTLVVGVTSKSAYGQLQVSGAASITGATVKVVALGTTAIAAGDSYTVVKAAGGLTFSNLTASIAGLGGSFFSVADAGSTGLVVSVGSAVTPTSFTATGVGAGGSGVGTGAALDAIADAGGAAAMPVITDILIPLASLPIAEQERGIIQLAPTQLTPQVVAIAVSPAVNAIIQHQEVLAANMSGRDERGMAAGSQVQRGSVWGQFLANSAERGNARDSSPYQATSFGLMVGADFLAAPDLVVGGAVNWLNSTAKGRGDISGSRTEIDSLQATGYFTWQPGPAGLAIDGHLGFGYNFYNQRRQIDFLERTASSSFDGQQYLANIRASYTIPVSETASVTPFAALRAVHLSNDRYTEAGAGAANLEVGKLKVDTVGHELGIQGSAIFDSASGRIIPSLKIGWAHNYANGPIALSAVLGGVAFTSTSSRAGRDGATVGAGLAFMRSDQIRIGVQYDGEYRNSFQSHTGTVRLTVNF